MKIHTVSTVPSHVQTLLMKKRHFLLTNFEGVTVGYNPVSAPPHIHVSTN